MELWEYARVTRLPDGVTPFDVYENFVSWLSDELDIKNASEKDMEIFYQFMTKLKFGPSLYGLFNRVIRTAEQSN